MAHASPDGSHDVRVIGRTYPTLGITESSEWFYTCNTCGAEGIIYPTRLEAAKAGAEHQRKTRG